MCGEELDDLLTAFEIFSVLLALLPNEWATLDEKRSGRDFFAKP